MNIFKFFKKMSIKSDTEKSNELYEKVRDFHNYLDELTIEQLCDIWDVHNSFRLHDLIKNYLNDRHLSLSNEELNMFIHWVFKYCNSNVSERTILRYCNVIKSKRMTLERFNEWYDRRIEEKLYKL